MQISAKKLNADPSEIDVLKGEVQSLQAENKVLKGRLAQAEQTNADISLVQQELLEVLIEMEVI